MKQNLKTPKLIAPRVFNDDYDFLLETFHAQRYKEETRDDLDFVQDNHSHSVKNGLTDLHLQITKP